MVSYQKRMKYVSENEMTSEEDSSYDNESDPKYKKNEQNHKQRPGRKPKCFSKNALMARENRLKKKMYINSLENQVSTFKAENKKLNAVVDNQSFLIGELKKEVKYLKSVLANSTDIGRLLRNIHQNTGMSVSSSLDKSLSLKSGYVSKPKLPIARKTSHPWEESIKYPSFPSPESLSDVDITLGNDNFDNLDVDLMTDFTFALPEDDILRNVDINEDLNLNTPSPSLEEHNYTATSSNGDDNDEDVGVCLHVSKHKVSLEFCSSCSENATHSWKNSS